MPLQWELVAAAPPADQPELRRCTVAAAVARSASFDRSFGEHKGVAPERQRPAEPVAAAAAAEIVAAELALRAESTAVQQLGLVSTVDL